MPIFPTSCIGAAMRTISAVSSARPDIFANWADMAPTRIVCFAVSLERLSGGKLRQIYMTLRILPGWRQRLRLLKEYVFPPAAYMLNRYQTKHRWLLPLLYGHRTIQGAWRGFR